MCVGSLCTWFKIIFSVLVLGSYPAILLLISVTTFHNCLATLQLTKKWIIVSFSLLQKEHKLLLLTFHLNKRSFNTIALFSILYWKTSVFDNLRNFWVVFNCCVEFIVFQTNSNYIFPFFVHYHDVCLITINKFIKLCSCIWICTELRYFWHQCITIPYRK